tara:strand:- start:451 stop:684 length:234 start_codon:yes stop_codon:yes gene_type:complete
MKTFFLTLIGAIVSGYASFYAALGCLRALLWLFDYELTISQRTFVSENGYLAFIAGMVVGMVVFWRVFRVQKVQHFN